MSRPAGRSRRRTLAGCCLLVVASALLVGSTGAFLFDAETATGSVQVDDDPELSFNLVDRSAFFGARYEIQYQIQWVDDFENVTIHVENLADSTVSETFSETEPTGGVVYPSAGTYDDGSYNDTYRFTFEVFEAGSSSPVITRQVTDRADGNGTQDGDFQNVGDPTLDTYTIVDDSGPFVDYTVEYEVGNATQENFNEVVVTFDNLNVSSHPGSTATNTSEQGTISYPLSFVPDDSTYEITIEVRNGDGLVVDSATVVDDADGTDP